MAKKGSVSTSVLLGRLTAATSVRTFLRHHRHHLLEGSLAEYLCEVCEQKQMIHEHVIQRSGIDRTYGHQIFNGRRKNPSRDKLILLAFGMSMTLAETQRMLLLGKKVQLHARVMRDDVIIFCLDRGLGIAQVEEMLFDLSLPTLEKPAG